VTIVNGIVTIFKRVTQQNEELERLVKQRDALLKK